MSSVEAAPPLPPGAHPVMAKAVTAAIPPSRIVRVRIVIDVLLGGGSGEDVVGEPRRGPRTGMAGAGRGPVGDGVVARTGRRGEGALVRLVAEKADARASDRFCRHDAHVLVTVQQAALDPGPVLLAEFPDAVDLDDIRAMGEVGGVAGAE